MTNRHTVDSITSDALDQLYAERDQLRAVVERARQVHSEACRIARGEGTSFALCSMCDALGLPGPAATEATDTMKEQQ